jgi:hypothetical protein
MTIPTRRVGITRISHPIAAKCQRKILPRPKPVPRVAYCYQTGIRAVTFPRYMPSRRQIT